MALDCFISTGAVLGCCGVCEARPCGIVSGINGCKPSGFDGKPRTGMKIPYKHGNTELVTIVSFGSCGAWPVDIIWECTLVVGRVVGLLVESSAKLGIVSALESRIEKASKEDDWPWQDLVLWPLHLMVL